MPTGRPSHVFQCTQEKAWEGLGTRLLNKMKLVCLVLCMHANHSRSSTIKGLYINRGRRHALHVQSKIIKKSELYMYMYKYSFHNISATVCAHPVYIACIATMFPLLFTRHTQCTESKFSISCWLVLNFAVSYRVRVVHALFPTYKP